MVTNNRNHHQKPKKQNILKSIMLLFSQLKSNQSPILPVLISIIYFILVYSLIHVSPITGIADQGDFNRMLNWIGVFYQKNGFLDNKFNWINRYFHMDHGQIGDTFSSELVFLYIARWINIFFHPHVFDLKILGIVHTAAASVVLGLFLYQVKKINFWHFVFATLFSIYTLTDISYISYFNSSYQEPAGLIFLYLFITMLIKSITTSSPSRDKKNYILLGISSILLIAAKPQYFILFLPIILVNFLVFRGKIAGKMLIAGSIAITLATFSLLLFGTSSVIKKWNVYNTIFSQAIRYADDQKRAIKLIGIDNQFLKYADTSAHDQKSGVEDLTLVPELHTGRMIQTLKYYLMTPKQIFTQSNKIATHSFSSIINYLGYYEHAPGVPAKTQPKKHRHWETVKQRHLKAMSPILPPLLLVAPIIFLYAYFKTRNKLLILGLFLSSAATSQFYIVTFTEGLISPEKHLFLYSLLFDGLILYMILMIGELIVVKYRHRKH